MNFKTIIIVLGTLLSKLSVRAQDLKPLSIGDTLPDLTLHNIINYKDSVIKLSDFKDRMVILDFWATWCGNCYDGLKLLDSLKKMDSHKMAVLAITQQSRETVVRFLGKRKDLAHLDIYYVYEDTLLYKVFPYRLLPHEVILRPGNTVGAITRIEYINSASLDSLMVNPTYRLPVKNDRMDVSKDASLFEIQDSTDESTGIYRKSFRHYIKGIASRYSFSDTGGYLRLEYVNLSLASMYKDLLWKLYKVPDIQLRQRDSSGSGIQQSNAIQWKERHYFCYAFEKKNVGDRNVFYQEVLRDLDNAFHVHTTILSGKVITAIINPID